MNVTRPIPKPQFVRRREALLPEVREKRRPDFAARARAVDHSSRDKGALRPASGFTVTSIRAFVARQHTISAHARGQGLAQAGIQPLRERGCDSRGHVMTENVQARSQAPQNWRRRARPRAAEGLERPFLRLNEHTQRTRDHALVNHGDALENRLIITRREWRWTHPCAKFFPLSPVWEFAIKEENRK